MREKGMPIRTITLIAVMTAVTCVLAPFTLPIGPVPISLTNFVIFLGVYVLGTKRETISYLIYLLIGLIGVPVFSGFSGGVGKLFGPTGGYLIGFVPMLLIGGYIVERTRGKFLPSFLGMILGAAVCNILGTIWLAFQANLDFRAALFAGVIPFLPGDLVKIVLAAVLGPKISTGLRRAGMV